MQEMTTPAINGMVFIPQSTYMPRHEHEPASAEFMGTISAGLAEVSGMHALAHAIHFLEAIDPMVHYRSQPANMAQSRFLQYIDNANVVETPQGAGSNPGVWLDMKTAVQMGLVFMPQAEIVAQFELPMMGVDQIQAFRDSKEPAPVVPTATSRSFQSPRATNAWGKNHKKRW